MTDPIRKSEELHLGASQAPAVRIVLGEVDAPGSLHYLLESEGFLVVARASDELELARVLKHGLDPDVVVLDTDISVESVLVAQELAPAAHVIVVWPDGVQNLPHTERIAPWLVYEQLGPAIRRAVHERPHGRAASDHVTEELPSVADEPMTPAAEASPRRAASRLSVASVVLIGVLMLTMGAAIAMDSWHVRLPWTAPRTGATANQAPISNTPTTATPTAHRPEHAGDPTKTGSCRPTGDGVRKGPNSHASRTAVAHARTCPIHNGHSGNKPDHPGKNDHPNKPDHPSKPDHSAGKPRGSSGTPTDHTSSTHPGPQPDPSPPSGKADHRPS